MNQVPSLDRIARSIESVAGELGWSEHHTPSAVLRSLVVEVAELMDRTLWMREDDVDRLFQVEGAPGVADELADVLINVMALARLTSVDLEVAVATKLNETRAKYLVYGRGASRASRTCVNCRSSLHPSWVACPRCGSTSSPRANSQSADQTDLGGEERSPSLQDWGEQP